MYRCLSMSGTSLDFLNKEESWDKLDEVRTSLHAIGFTAEVCLFLSFSKNVSEWFSQYDRMNRTS